jgi:hypothetical protein
MHSFWSPHLQEAMTLKAFHFTNAQIGTISTRVDGGVGFRISTGEIPVENLAHFLSLKQKNVEIIIRPLDMEEGDEPVEVKSEAEQKTPGQRQRALLFLIWKAQGSQGDFSSFYATRMERNIQRLKDELASLED